MQRAALAVLVQTGGGEEEAGFRPGQGLVAELEGVAAGRADEAVVDQVVAEMGVHAAAQLRIAGEVEVEGRDVGREALDVGVGLHHLVGG